MAKFTKGAPGRPKGAINHLTRTVKETVLAVFNELETTPRKGLIIFAKKYPRDFYNIAAKLIPTELSGTINHKIINVEYSDNLAKDSYTTSGATPGPEDEKTV